MVSKGLVRKRPYVISTGNTPAHSVRRMACKYRYWNLRVPRPGNYASILVGVHSLHSGFRQR
jgi:hypothetical protein